MVDFFMIGAYWGAAVAAFIAVLLVCIGALIGLMFLLAEISDTVLDRRKQRRKDDWGLYHRWQKINAEDWVEFETFKRETYDHFTTWRKWDRQRREEEKTHD